MKTAIITCTGDRPQAFSLCQRWVDHQTVKPDQWIVVNDGISRSGEVLYPRSELISRLILPPPIRGNSLTRNLDLAFEMLDPDIEVVMFAEDDDYYAPNYLETMIRLFETNPAVDCAGVANSIYYNVASAVWKNLSNYSYAPLAFTVFKRGLIPLLQQSYFERAYKTFDTAFWRKVLAKHLNTSMYVQTPKDPPICIGVKSMPGRAGIGIGHRPIGADWQHDLSRNKASVIFGKDFAYYNPFIGPAAAQILDTDPTEIPKD